MADIHSTSEPSTTAARRGPRPFSLAIGIIFIVIGVASVISGWAGVDAGAVAALALLLGGTAALIAIGRRRALS